MKRKQVRWNKETRELEKQCLKCGAWLPASAEFFNVKRGRIQSPCRACIQEKRLEVNRTEPCCVPGCNEPRKPGVYSRCEQHQREARHDWKVNHAT